MNTRSGSASCVQVTMLFSFVSFGQLDQMVLNSLLKDIGMSAAVRRKIPETRQ